MVHQYQHMTFKSPWETNRDTLSKLSRNTASKEARGARRLMNSLSSLKGMKIQNGRLTDILHISMCSRITAVISN